MFKALDCLLMVEGIAPDDATIKPCLGIVASGTHCTVERPEVVVFARRRDSTLPLGHPSKGTESDMTLHSLPEVERLAVCHLVKY